VNHIVRLPKQFLAAPDTAALASGARPDETGSTIVSRGSQAGFDSHLAGLERHLFEGNSFDCAPSLFTFAQQGFSPADKRAPPTKPECNARALISPRDHKPGEPTVPTAAQTRSGRGSKSPAELSTQGMLLALGEVNSRTGSLRGYLFGAPAPVSPVTRISPGAEKLSRNSSSRDSSHALSFHANKAPEAAFLPVSPHGYCAPKTLPLVCAPALPENCGPPHSRATTGEFRAGGDQNGEGFQRSKPDLLSVVGQDGNRRFTVAGGQPPATDNKRLSRINARSIDPAPVRFRAAECGDLNELVLGAFDLEERAAAPDWNRKLNIATLAPITITSIKREAHLAVVETAALSRNLVRSPHFPLPSLAARECAISTALDEAQLQPANQGYKSRAAQTEDGPGAKGSAAKNEYQDSGGNRPVNFQALSLNEKDPVAANPRSPASNSPCFSQRSSPASVLGIPGVQEGNLPQPPPQSVGRHQAWPSPNGEPYICVTQRERQDSQLIAATRADEPVAIDKAGVSAGKSFSLAGNMPTWRLDSVRSNLFGGPAGAGLSQMASQRFNVPAAQLQGSNAEAIVAGSKGVRTIDEISLVAVPTLVVHEPHHPVSALMLSPAAQIAISIIGTSGKGDSSPETTLAQSQPIIHLAAETAAFATQILHLQLEPEKLGKVIVKMRLSGSKLELQVDAERPETMRLIGDDKTLLSDRLQSAGYAIDKPRK
jgi:Flagellar hook-length control protein FliK